MLSKLRRTSSLARLGGGAGIGALALVTGGCSSGGEPSGSTDYGVDAPAGETSTAEPRTDSDVAAAPAAAPAAETPGEAGTDSDLSGESPAAAEAASTEGE